MKKILYIILISIISVSFYACEELKFGNEFLDNQPEAVGATTDTMFSSTKYAERVLTRAYSRLPQGIPTGWSSTTNKLHMATVEDLTDLSHNFTKWGGAMTHYYPGQYNAGLNNTSRFGFGATIYGYGLENTWSSIRYAYLFMENVDRVPDMSEEVKKIRKAEATALIALQYSVMFRFLGGVPWLDHAVEATEVAQYPRMTVDETVNKIDSMLVDAAKDLPWTNIDPNDDGRLTKAAALALRVRVLTFAASPLFNADSPYRDGAGEEAWYGNYDVARWQRAADAAKEFTDALNANGQYGMVSTGNPRQDFQDGYFDRGNGEVLISSRITYNGNLYGINTGWVWNRWGVTFEYSNMFPMADGTDFPENFDWENPPFNPFENRDPRFYETIVVPGDSYKGRTAEMYRPDGREYKQAKTCSGLLLRKFALERNTATNKGAIKQWPILRLPEVYLSYAEALNEVNGAPTAEAVGLVKMVRDRVGVGMGNISTSMSKEEFREALLKERALEFGYEEVRWFDNARWKKEENFKKQLHGIWFDKINNSKNYPYKFVVWNLPARAWSQNWDAKWFLCAFPRYEIDKGYGLVQNPGW